MPVAPTGVNANRLLNVNKHHPLGYRWPAWAVLVNIQLPSVQPALQTFNAPPACTSVRLLRL